jgi:hypothetical protein
LAAPSRIAAVHRLSLRTPSIGRCCRALTADDLRDIGIVAVGHRHKLLEAIAALDKADSFVCLWPVN